MMTGSSDLAMGRTLADDRSEYRGRDVLAGLGFADDEFLLVLHHAGEILDCHIAAQCRTVEAFAAIPLDQDRLSGSGHVVPACPRPHTGSPAHPATAFKIGGFRRPGYPFSDRRSGRGTMRGVTWIKDLAAPI